MSIYLQNCPAGHHVDYNECPYPADRSGKRYQINCTDSDCPWELIGPTREEVIEAWNYLPEQTK